MSESETQLIIEKFWQQFLATLPAADRQQVAAQGYCAEMWGDSPALADELGALIAAGTKTATCSALWSYEAEGEAIPTVGSYTIVLDGRGAPLCLVQTTEVTVRPFNTVDAEFAHAEGEDDRSLASWRAAHQRFFTRTLAQIGRTPTAEMPLVCERFRLIRF